MSNLNSIEQEPVDDVGFEVEPVKAGPDDDFDFWRYEDLEARKIVSDRPDLHRKQKDYDFPRGLRINHAQGAIALFRKVDVKRWLLEHLREFDPSTPTKTGRPRGRPRKHPEQVTAE